MENMKKILFIAFAGLWMSACATVHEFPEDGGIDPTLVNITLNLDIDMNYYGEITRQSYEDYALMLENDYDIRYTVEIYKAKDKDTDILTDRVAKFVQTSDEVVFDGRVRITQDVRLPAREYVILAWVDFVNKSGSADLYYKTDQLTDVSILKPEGRYEGYNTTKDAFCGKVKMNLEQYRFRRMARHTVTCPVMRPLAVYKIIATDVGKYLYNNPKPYSSIRPATTDVRYLFDFPMAYTTQFERPYKFEPSVGYSFGVEGSEEQSEALIASDYVLVGTEERYPISFDVKDAGANLINSVNNLDVRLKRNYITIIRNEFLTTDNSSGIGIDDKFAGEIIVQL